MSKEMLQELREGLVAGDRDKARTIVGRMLADGTSAQNIMEVMLSAMGEVGRKYECHEYFLPDLILSGQALKACMQDILPHLAKEGQHFRGKIILGAVQGDVHDLGKSIVASVLTGTGYEVFDLGVDVAPKVFAEKAQELNADVVGASAYMTTTTAQLPKVNEALKAAGIRDRVKFIIGGAATADSYVSWAGADGWGENAWTAVDLINNLLKKRPERSA